MVQMSSMFARPLRAGLLVLAMMPLLCAAPARGQVSEDLARLGAAFQLDALFGLVAQEGLDNAANLRAELLGPAAGDTWDRALAAIYDPVRLSALFMEALEPELAGQPHVIAAALAFAESPAGRQLTQLELDARAAMLDDDIDQAARDRLASARAADAETLEFVRARIAVHDLLEMNVSIGLNSAMAYVAGFEKTAPEDLRRGQSGIIGDPWAQEAAIRLEAQEWLEAYFLLAYAPLSDEHRAEAMAHFAAPEGMALNAALFIAFDRLFSGISMLLGAEVGRVLSARDI